MRWTRVGSITLCSVSFAVALVSWSCTRGPATHAGSSAEDKVARGRYLVTVLGCNDCHTPGTLYGAPDTTRLLSGSELGWKGPWGVSFPRNLTPDPETGLGMWTDDQIVTAIRQGRRPDNTPLLPPMPWPDFAHLTDEDAYAVAAYIKSIPPVKHANIPTVPPTGTYTGAAMVFPPPPVWDAQHLPPPSSPGPGATALPDTGVH